MGIHPRTALLAIQLQLADVQSALQELNEGDEWKAWKILQHELEYSLSLLQDQVFAMDLLKECSKEHRDNQAVIAKLLREEKQAEEDHDLACKLRGIANKHVPLSKRGDMMQPLNIDDDCDQDLTMTEGMDLPTETLALIDAYEHTEHDIESAAASNYDLYSESGPSKFKGKGKGKATTPLDNGEHATHILCSACMELHPRFDALELSCKRSTEVSAHAYCRTCLSDLFHTSLADTTLFPPRCCGESLPMSRCKQLCPPSLMAEYEDKQMELTTPNPVYCSNRSCAKFIKPCNITADIAVCQTCQKETCAVCQNPRHNGVCPEDPSIQALIKVATEEEWQRCPNCRTMVELTLGCYHMRCRCGKEFCYICAKPWKTCTCPHTDVVRLLADRKATRVSRRKQIAMPEILEAGLRMRLATVAGGFAIVNDENADGVAKQSSGKCDHQWERTFGEDGEWEEVQDEGL
ncbi:hypothetical protein PSV09DRAFT_2417705 [Bipolaris maydis]|nr:hypothetical protein BM1_01575 [Bipolaris maydis]KAJ5060089.1 hypothetical protein J3E74DRAFT_452373 [Bipolaris maydis]KAJ6210880.1 hypothetical protein PSV09DRAFT_2417705 [Bipolaris maydis]